MLGRTDIVAVVVALAAHAGLAYGLAHMPPLPDRPPSVVEVEVRKPKPPEVKQETPPPPKPPEPPPKKIVQIKRPAAPPPIAAPPPNREPPPEPPKEPPKPVFGVTMESTTEGSSFSVPVGNTTMIDPAKSGKGSATPLPAAPPPPPKPSYQPVSELYIKTMPDIDGEACGRSIPYPPEAEQLGIEGVVHLRIELDEKGHVHAVKVTSGLGHGLDQAALFAMTHRAECRFKAAVTTDGKAAPFVINDYKFTFEIPR